MRNRISFFILCSLFLLQACNQDEVVAPTPRMIELESNHQWSKLEATPTGSFDQANLEMATPSSTDAPPLPIWYMVENLCEYFAQTYHFIPNCYEKVNLRASGFGLDTLSFAFYPTEGTTWKFYFTGYGGDPSYEGFSQSHSVPGGGGGCHFDLINDHEYATIIGTLTENDSVVGQTIYNMAEKFQTELYQKNVGNARGFYFRIPPAIGSSNIQKVEFWVNGKFVSSMLNPSLGGNPSRSSWSEGTKVQSRTILKDGRTIYADIVLQ